MPISQRLDAIYFALGDARGAAESRGLRLRWNRDAYCRRSEGKGIGACYLRQSTPWTQTRPDTIVRGLPPDREATLSGAAYT